MIRVTVDFGFDVHTIIIPEATFAEIQAGLPVVVEGQGFPVEGLIEQDQWAFNFGALWAINVSTDTGREVFEGGLGDNEVVIHHS